MTDRPSGSASNEAARNSGSCAEATEDGTCRDTRAGKTAESRDAQCCNTYDDRPCNTYDDRPCNTYDEMLKMHEPDVDVDVDGEIRPLELAADKGSTEDVDVREGGYGWIVCFTSFWSNGVIFSPLNLFGIMYVQINKDFDDGTGRISLKSAWIGSILIGTTFFMSLIASLLADSFGIRKTAVAGACLAILGMSLSSVVRQLEVLYLTYGFLVGFGVSLVYNPSLVILGYYFHRRLGFVNGVVSFGSSFFTLILPFGVRHSLRAFGLQRTMLAMACLMTTLVFCSLTWIPVVAPKTANAEKKRRCAGISAIVNKEIWRNKGFVLWTVALPIAFLGYFIPFVHLVRHANDVSSHAQGEVLVMCLGGTSGVSRLIFGKISDLQGMNRIWLQQAALLLLGVCSMAIAFAHSYTLLICISMLMGLADGCIICLLGPIAFDLLGTNGAAQGLGAMLAISSLPMTAGPAIAGWSYDQLNSYKWIFFAAGFPPMIAMLILFKIPKTKQISNPLSMASTLSVASQHNASCSRSHSVPNQTSLQFSDSQSNILFVSTPNII